MKLLFLIFAILALATSSQGQRPDCKSPPVTGNCEALQFAWNYNPVRRTCEQFNYGGCGGNRNRYDSWQECMFNCAGQ